MIREIISENFIKEAGLWLIYSANGIVRKLIWLSVYIGLLGAAAFGSMKLIEKYYSYPTKVFKYSKIPKNRMFHFF